MGLGKVFCPPSLFHFPQLAVGCRSIGSVVEFLCLYHVRVYHSGAMTDSREKNAKIDGEMVE